MDRPLPLPDPAVALPAAQALAGEAWSPAVSAAQPQLQHAAATVLHAQASSHEDLSVPQQPLPSSRHSSHHSSRHSSGAHSFIYSRTPSPSSSSSPPRSPSPLNGTDPWAELAADAAAAAEEEEAALRAREEAEAEEARQRVMRAKAQAEEEARLLAEQLAQAAEASAAAATAAVEAEVAAQLEADRTAELERETASDLLSRSAVNRTPEPVSAAATFDHYALLSNPLPPSGSQSAREGQQRRRPHRPHAVWCAKCCRIMQPAAASSSTAASTPRPARPASATSSLRTFGSNLPGPASAWTGCAAIGRSEEKEEGHSASMSSWGSASHTQLHSAALVLRPTPPSSRPSTAQGRGGRVAQAVVAAATASSGTDGEQQPANQLCQQCFDFARRQESKNPPRVEIISLSSAAPSMQLVAPHSHSAPPAKPDLNLHPSQQQPYATVQRFSEPLQEGHVRRHGKQRTTGAPSHALLHGHGSCQALIAAALAVSPFDAAAPVASPRTLAAAPPHPAFSSVSDARDHRSLCLALAASEKLSFTRLVELELLRRQVTLAQGQAENAWDEAASARSDAARVAEVSSQRLRELSSMRSEARQAKEDAQKHSNEHARLNEEYAHLSEVFASLRTELELLQKEHESNVAQRNSLQAALDQSEQALASLRSEQAQASSALQGAQERASTSDAEANRLRDTVASQLRELEALRPALAEAQRREEATRRHAEQQQLELVLAQDAHAASSAALASLRTTHDSLVNDYSRASTSALSLRDELNALQAALIKSASAEASAEILRASFELEARAATVRRGEEASRGAAREAALQNEIDSLKLEVAAAQRSEQAHRELNGNMVRERAELLERVASAEAALDPVRSSLAASVERATKWKTRALAQGKKVLEAEALEVSWRNAAQAASLRSSQHAPALSEAKLDAEKSRAALVRSKVDNEARIASLRGAIDSAQKRLELAASEVSSLKARSAEEVSERRAAQQEASSSSARAQNALDRLQALQAKHARLSAAHAACPASQANLESWRKKASSLQSALATAQGKLASLQRSLDQSEARAAQAMALKGSVDSQRKEANSALSAANAEIKIKATALEAASAKEVAARCLAAAEQNKSTALSIEVARLKRTIAEGARSRSELEARHGEREHALSEQVAEARARIGQIEGEGLEGKHRLKEMGKQLAHAREEVKRAQMENAALQSQVQLMLHPQQRYAMDASTASASADQDSAAVGTDGSGSGTGAPASFFLSPPGAAGDFVSSSAAASARNSYTKRASSSGLSGWGVQLIELNPAAGPAVARGSETPAQRLERAQAEVTHVRGQMASLAQQLAQTRAEKLEQSVALDQAVLRATQLEQAAARKVEDASAKEQEALERAAKMEQAWQERLQQAEAARARVAEEVSTLQTRVDEVQMDLQLSCASESVLRERIAALDAEIVEQRAAGEAAAVAASNALSDAKDRLAGMEERSAEQSRTIALLTRTVREHAARAAQERMALVNETQAELSTTAATPDIHNQFRLVRSQLARQEEATATMRTRHEEAMASAVKAHTQALSASAKTQEGLLTQMSALRVAHGEELARHRAKLASLAQRSALAGRLYVSLRPALGLTFLADAASVRTNHGLLVTALRDGGPAALAGVLVGDVVEEIAGVGVRDANDVARALANVRAGQTCVVYVRRIVEHAKDAATTVPASSSPATRDTDADPTVQFLLLTLITASPHYTPHQLRVLRAASRMDAADGAGPGFLSAAASAAGMSEEDEHLLDLMLGPLKAQAAAASSAQQAAAAASAAQGAASTAPALVPGVAVAQQRSRRRSLQQLLEVDAATSTDAHDAVSLHAVMQ